MLVFAKAANEKSVKEVYDHNMSAFFDSEEFDWSLIWLKNQVKDGWNIYSISYDNEIIAAVFLKKKAKTLYLKQTPVKMSHQGNGFSHAIREYVEEQLASDLKVNNVISIIAIDNFRMVALNESHGYKKTGDFFEGSSTLVEWKKSF